MNWLHEPVVETIIQHLSEYGWVLLILLMERIGHIYKQPLFRTGLVSDVLYTYQNVVLQLLFATSAPIIIEGIATTAIAANFFPETGDGFLQNSLASQPLWANLIILILWGEIVFYTVHYYAHKIPFLWEFHRVHHSSRMVDSFSTSRFHVFDRFWFTFPNVLFMAYTGAVGDAIMIYFLMRTFMDRYIHANINGPRWTHKLLISSPHFHRWHHVTDRSIHNCNYSGDFIFMDVLFGTAYDPSPQEKTPPRPGEFGEPGYPSYADNIIVHQFLPFFFLYKRIFGKT